MQHDNTESTHIITHDAVRDPVRLHALRKLGLLDTPTEPAFDRLTRLASRVLHAPVATITLVDEDRQFFVSGVGVGEPWASARQTPLSYSFCHHAIASGQPLIIADTRAHPLGHANRAVAELDVIAYAGIPLKLDTGDIPGVLCVMCHEPRAWSADDISTLQDLAASVLTEIELRGEVAKLHQVEVALRQSEERYRNLVELCPDGIMIHRAGRVVYANQACAAFFGAATPEALHGHPVTALVDPQCRSQLEQRMNQLYQGGAVPFVEQRLVRLDGQTRYAEVAAMPIHYDDAIAAQVFIRDLTRHKEAEAAIREQEAILDSFYNSASMLMGVVETLDDDIIHHSDNAATARLFGRSVTTLRNQRASALGVPPDVISMWLTHYHASARAVGPVRFEYVHQGNDSNHWFAATVNPIANAPVRHPLFSYVIEDVTEQKAVAAALAASEQRFRALATYAPVGIFETDLHLNLLFVNERYMELTDLTQEQLRGTGWTQALHPDDRQLVVAEWHEAMNHEREFLAEARMQHPSSAIVWLHCRAVPVCDPDGNVRGYLGTLTDITARKHSEQQIKASLAEKEVLLKEIHHRVKNNLQVISSLLTLQAEAIIEPGMRELFLESQRRVRSMALIHEKLYQGDDLTQIDFGMYVTSLTTYLVRAYRANTHTVRIHTAIAEVGLDIDRALSFGLILSELVSNSLKHAFTAGMAGEISITLERDGNGNMVFTVCDNGVGLPPGFDPDASASMGLQVVTAFVTQLHGSITYHIDTGTVFTIIVPERTVPHA